MRIPFSRSFGSKVPPIDRMEHEKPIVRATSMHPLPNVQGGPVDDPMDEIDRMVALHHETRDKHFDACQQSAKAALRAVAKARSPKETK